MLLRSLVSRELSFTHEQTEQTVREIVFGSASEIVVNLKGGSVTGTVLDRDRKPLPNVIVALIPDEPLRPRFDLYRSTTTDAAGRYQLNRIPPGNYKLCSWEDIEAQSWLDRAVLRSYEDLGSPLAISEGSSPTLDLVAASPLLR